MSYASLLDRVATFARAGEAPDAGGVVRPNPDPFATDVPFRIARPSDRSAWRDDAGRLLVDYVGFAHPGPPATNLEPGDHVIVDGVTYYVTGKPLELRARGAVHHVEVPLTLEERT